MTSPSPRDGVHVIADDALGNTSYLVEVGGGAAVAIDPRRDVDPHLEVASEHHLEIIAVIETHLHADFVSGARELAAAVGAQIYAATGARLEGPHVPLEPGAHRDLGDATMDVLATPGHTPHHIAALFTSGETRMLFSGGSLIVGGVARTDLIAPSRTEELTREQFHSLRRIAALPDETLLYPTHGAGSFCSTGPARSHASTIGAERQPGSLFAIDDEDTFVSTLLAGFGSYPRYFTALGEVNRVGAPLLADLQSIEELSANAARNAVDTGAWLIDGRRVADWARSHPVGAISNEVRPAFPSWLGWIVPFGERMVFVLEPEQVSEATRLAHRIGYDRIAGWVRFSAWEAARLPTSSVDLVGPAEATARGANFLDVRQTSELAGGRIAGATHIELGDLIAGKTPNSRDVVTYCGHGERSATAASLLEREGFRVGNLVGGFSAWTRAHLPTEP